MGGEKKVPRLNEGDPNLTLDTPSQTGMAEPSKSKRTLIRIMKTNEREIFRTILERNGGKEQLEVDGEGTIVDNGPVISVFFLRNQVTGQKSDKKERKYSHELNNLLFFIFCVNEVELPGRRDGTFRKEKNGEGALGVTASELWRKEWNTNIQVTKPEHCGNV